MLRIREIVRLVVIFLRFHILTMVYGMDLSKTSRVSFGAKLDKTNPRGVHIDDESYVASGAIIFSHDFSRGIKLNTYIGKRCFIGANAIIMAGVTIGDEVVIGSGAVVTKSVDSHSIVVGNPAKVIRTGIRTRKFGQLME
jgi:acetyltransferase-like isoleucine patch superfamily enzyme